MTAPRAATFLAPLLLALPNVALAGSISAPGFLAGPDSNAATPNPAAPHYNPAALGGSEGVKVMADIQMAFIRVDATTTRNNGIDPNTGNPYLPSQARVQVPVALLGVSWKIIDQLAFGFSVSDTMVGGGDYTAAEPDNEPPYVGHQRYAGVTTKLITLHMIPAVAVTPVKGLHLGGGLKVIYDSISALQAADPLGTEGVNPSTGEAYTGDTYLSGDASGMHLGWNAGIYVDKWKFARVGISFTDNGQFSAKGDGSVRVPAYLSTSGEDTTVPAKVSFDYPLPPILQFWVNSDITDKLTLGAGVEYQMWNACCGGPEGDIVIGVTDEAGNPVGPDSGLTITVDPVQYSPRRLWNSGNYAINGSYELSKNWWVGGRMQYSQNAVPDYAVTATNLDYESVGGQLAARYRFGKEQKFTVGLSYSKFFTKDRVITDSAWNLGNGDERFNPETPYKASSNGTFSSKVDIVGLRLAGRF